MKDLRIYIHVPFCKQRCAYCDFTTYDDKIYLADSYFKAVDKELALYAPIIDKSNVRSIFFGGGTPSYPEAEYLTGLLSKCNPGPDCEISLEANPGTVDKEKLIKYKKAGFNRISFGVQSFTDDVLLIMGRIHNSETAVRNIREAKEAGFDNISIDLILGYPLQTPDMFRKSLKTAVSLGIKHISCYSLKVPEGTPLEEMIKNKLLPYPSDEDDREMYESTIDILGKAGFGQYEISNFAIPGFESSHNTGYWKLDDYLGVGVAAHSYYDNRRFSNTDIPGDYIRSLGEYKIPEVSSDDIDNEESMKEFMILGLRMTAGVDANEFRSKYNKNLLGRFRDEISESMEAGLVETSGSNIKLTRKGMDFANEVFRKFI